MHIHSTVTVYGVSSRKKISNVCVCFKSKQERKKMLQE